MTDGRQDHALAVERVAPELADLRIELCPIHMSEGCFWMIYFVLMDPRLTKEDAEILSTLQGETKPFKSYSHRYPTPNMASGSTVPYWFSIKRASAYIIIRASYGKYTPQYKWLEAEFPKVNRSETPWLIFIMHTQWYNSYNYHNMEGETMRVMYELWFVKYKVDLVFGGHVHAYEQTDYVQNRILNIAYNMVNDLCTPIPDQSVLVYITIGDGGNQEGLPTK
ncbi:hypothetical protein QOZ80_UnG0725840 [Eleusine coracana subsp. coracana]|uniref:BSD domain-containing protein n=1 Tax=Eleusine coracana subsp. coracana TaxID=191504 RepID=A0AAV9G2X7_ELECO|nr:hypothetical protein QOZ80_UnG0725840 [Eleusine coracana subsp. coracana]